MDNKIIHTPAHGTDSVKHRQRGGESHDQSDSSL